MAIFTRITSMICNLKQVEAGVERDGDQIVERAVEKGDDRNSKAQM